MDPDDPRLKPEYAQQYARKIQVLTWYVDEYLPMAAGVQWFGPTIRPYYLPCDTLDIGGGQMKVYVTITSEAFGRLVFENCRDKWVEIFKWRDAQPSSKKRTNPPTYKANKPETHKFKAKWSDNNIGQTTGWSKDAYERMKELMAEIKAFRESDAENDNAKQAFGRALIRSIHGIKDDEEEEPPKKKRKSGTESGEVGQNGGENQVSMIYYDE